MGGNLFTRINVRHVVPLSVLWTAIACGPREGPNSSSKPDDPEKTRQVTVWGERYEIFLEHPSIVAGSGVTFVTHVTDLNSLEPRREGLVEFLLRKDAKEAVLECPEPTRPGIYTPEVTFPSAGTWQVSIRVPGPDGVREIGLGPFEVHATRDAVAAAEAPEAPEGISFLKEQQWKISLGTAPVGRLRMVERRVLPGTIRPRPDGRASVTPLVAGTLLPPPGKTLPALGTAVEAGQVLARVQPPVLDLVAKVAEAEAEVVRTSAVLERAETLLARTRKLAAEKARSTRDLEDAEFAARRARIDRDAAAAVSAAYRRAGAVLETTGGDEGFPSFDLRAPISGMITSWKAAAGERVSPELGVAEIVDVGRLYVEAKVPEVDVPGLSTDLAAFVEIPDATGSSDPLRLEAGAVVLLSPEVDSRSRTVAVTYEIADPDGRLRIGMNVAVHIRTARAEDTLVVPLSAIVDEDVRHVAFVQLSGETFEKRELALGIRDGDFVQVLSGLEEGERVVTRGSYALRLASVSTSIPAHGHAH